MKAPRDRHAVASAPPRVPEPLAWSFDGPWTRCLGDLEDTLRRALLQIGDVAAVAVLIEISLPRLAARVAAGDAVQPAWRELMERLTRRYGLPAAPRVRPVRGEGPLAVLIVAYRS